MKYLITEVDTDVNDTHIYNTFYDILSDVTTYVQDVLDTELNEWCPEHITSIEANVSQFLLEITNHFYDKIVQNEDNSLYSNKYDITLAKESSKIWTIEIYANDEGYRTHKIQIEKL